jgi:hypothetical protein
MKLSTLIIGMKKGVKLTRLFGEPNRLLNIVCGILNQSLAIGGAIE